MHPKFSKRTKTECYLARATVAAIDRRRKYLTSPPQFKKAKASRIERGEEGAFNDAGKPNRFRRYRHPSMSDFWGGIGVPKRGIRVKDAAKSGCRGGPACSQGAKAKAAPLPEHPVAQPQQGGQNAGGLRTAFQAASGLQFRAKFNRIRRGKLWHPRLREFSSPFARCSH